MAATAVAERTANASEDTEAHAIAEAFARAFLTWDESEPAVRPARLRKLAPQLSSDLEGFVPAPGGRQSVLWSAVTRDEAIGKGHRVTVLVETTNGFVSLAVSMVRERDGLLAISEFPAVVGTPPVSRDFQPWTSEAVNDRGVESTVTRALRGYLGRRGDALAADLLPGAVVVVPDERLHLVAVEEMTWTEAGRAVRVVLRAEVRNGVELRLTYAVGVARQAGRWFVRWIGTQQTGGGRSR